MHNISRISLVITLLALSLAFTGCGEKKPDKPGAPEAPGASAKPAAGSPDATAKPAEKPVEVAFITNNPSDFWMIAKAGIMKAEKDFNATCEVKMPPNGTVEEQKQAIEDMVARGVSGIAISPKDSKNQTDVLNRAAAAVHLICHDSDAPESNRLAYVGSNNVNAGRAAGELLREALPNGGKVMLFVGSKDAQNAQERMQGLELAIAGSRIEILGVRTDETDRQKAQANVADAIANHPDLAACVGLWSYNGPAILEAVKKADKLGKIQIIAFDEEDAVLQGVKDGHIFGTVVQDPYLFGYESVRVLAALARKQDAKIPESKVIEIPVQKIRQANVDAFWTTLRDRISSAKKPVIRK
jgi:ribose transport system substrate-binding protein